ncbi:DUF555 domain-containing protein [Halomicroarcula sp. GCM10025324]|uniref:DUF555 domain-containing protein n=1 Tax=Halomicroarcula sp. GCM10025324 TaxID=3252667 RepID=UPI00360E4362
MNKHATHAEDWYQVRLTLPWVVPGAPGVQDAINIAVAEVGRRADASAVHSADISVQDVACPAMAGRWKQCFAHTATLWSYWTLLWR